MTLSEAYTPGPTRDADRPRTHVHGSTPAPTFIRWWYKAKSF